MMSVEISMATNGADDAHALATIMRKAADDLSAGGGDLVTTGDRSDTVDVPGGYPPQTVFWSMRSS